MPFRVLITGWSGKGELPTLTAAEVPFKPVLIQGRALVGAWYMNELLLRFLARLDAHPALYDQYVESIEKLASGMPIDIVLRHFECHLLRDIGYGLDLDREADSNRRVEPDREYWYVIDRGPVALANSVQEPSALETAIRVNGRTLIGLARGQLDESGSREEARALLRAALSRQLAGKPLRSRQYLHQLGHFVKTADRHSGRDSVSRASDIALDE